MKPNCLFRIAVLLIVASATLTAQVTRQQTVVPLKNWVTPLYWHPNQVEKEAGGKAQPQLQFSANAVSTDALTFVAITLCRLVDTRGGAFNGISPFSGPSIAPTGSVTIPVQSGIEGVTDTSPAPCGAIPPIAQAYSFNLTVVPHAGGAVDYVTLWPAGGPQPFVSTLDDPQGAIVSNAAIVPVGTPTGGISVFNSGPAITDVIIDMNGYFTAPTDLSGNTAVGTGTLANNVVGAGILLSLGSENTATGAYALNSNTSGDDNTANGGYALAGNTSGNNNTATGIGALNFNTTGSYNTATGDFALDANTSGSNNIAVGNHAAYNVSGGSSNNIHIGSWGVATDGAGPSGVIRIGAQGTQTGAFIAGISGASPSTPNLLVCVDAKGQLGTGGCSSTPSSRRFKEQIADMGDNSSNLLQLRPVTFFYKPQYDDGSHTLQYGLIAEEVAKLYPDMVGYDQDGQPSSVKYQSLAPMLLNEVQKQNVQLQQQLEINRLQQEHNRKLEDRLGALEALRSSETSTPARPASSQ